MTTRQADTPAWLVTAAAAVAAATIAAAVAPWDTAYARPHVPWVAVAVAIALAERARVHFHVAREAHSFTLVDLPTTVGLYLLAPPLLIAARAVGTAVALARPHTRSPVKFAFNVANGTLETAVAVVAFRGLVDALRPMPGGDYVAGLAAMAVAHVVGTLTVWLVIRLVERTRGLGDLVASLQLGLPIALANGALALMFVLVLRTNPALSWIPVLPLGILLLAQRAYAAQWEHRDALAFLYDTAVGTQASPDLDHALLLLTGACRDHLRADVAELVAITSPGAPAALVASVGPGDTREVRRVATPDLPLEVRQRIRQAAPAETARDQSVSVRGNVPNGGTVLLTVRDPVGNAAAFTDRDRDVVRALARLAVTSITGAELDELKASFLRAVSHELRTPLTVVLGATSTLKRRGHQLTEARRERLIEQLDNQAQRLNRLLSDLLDLDRLSRGMVAPSRVRVDLAELAATAAARVDTPNHDVRVSAGPVPADVDPGLVERIVENLVHNAAKYTPDGTAITVDAFRTDHGVAISVEDEGDGIPERMRSSVLEPFVRLHHDHPKPGTGIGLTLVRLYAELHGGNVTIGDSVGGGARVVASLPDPGRAATDAPDDGARLPTDQPDPDQVRADAE